MIKRIRHDFDFKFKFNILVFDESKNIYFLFLTIMEKNCWESSNLDLEWTTFYF